MRRALLAGFFAVASVAILAVPSGAGADPSPNVVVLSFDFSDNTSSASVSTNASPAPFNIIADVFPEHTGGVVRMVASPPDSSPLPNLVCKYAAVQQSQVECAFNFTTNGVWSIQAQYATDTKSPVSSVSITRLRVTNSN